MLFLRQNATHKVVIGPFVDVGDGFTPETGITLGAADEAEAILHDNGTVVDISGYTWAAITTADGYYHLTLQAGITSTIGHLTVIVHDDSVCLPVKADFTVVEESVYDNMFASAAVGPLTAAQVNAEADTALTDYDPPTRTELTSDKDEIITDLDDIKGTGFVKDTHSLIDIETYADLIDDGTSGLAKIATDVAAILVDTADIQPKLGTPAGADISADIAALLADILDKVGAVGEAAAAGDPSATESVMQYVKQIVNILVGTAGVTTYPAAAAPGNAVSLAEIIRAIYDDTNELQTDDYPTSIAAVQSDTDDIQTRLPAALVGGRMDSDVGATTGTMTATPQGAPPTTPTIYEALMVLYDALVHKVDVTATLKEFHNDAGTVIWKKTLSDDGTTYSEAESATGP